jgi:hypothetical protein
MTKTTYRLALVLGFWGLAAQAADATNTYEVRENWELRLDTPNVTKNSPQVVTHFKVDADTFVLTCINFHEQPSHVPGGVQIQLWDEGALIDTADVALDALDVTGDVITWTQVYKLYGGQLEAQVVGVGSQAWGQNINTSSVIKDPASVSTFNTYNPTESVAESHVNYGHNAVIWFGMTESSTWADTNNKLTTDTTDRTVYAR